MRLSGLCTALWFCSGDLHRHDEESRLGAMLVVFLALGGIEGNWIKRLMAFVTFLESGLEY